MSEEMTGGTIADQDAFGLEEDDLMISEEVAFYIAEFFIRDMIETDQTCWDDETAILDTVLMYDETGEAVTGYTFELTSGYIVVSAYVDIPSLILEWSDVGDPVYKNAEMDREDKVVYLGALEYYIDEGETTLETVDGNLVNREDLYNEFEEQRSIENVNDDVLSAIIDAKEEQVITGGITTFLNTTGQIITDPITYAKNVYGGSWWSNDYANYWESHTSFLTDSDLKNTIYTNACGPIAIANIIQMYGSKYNNKSIKNDTKKDTFYEVIDANGGWQWKYYDLNTGTPMKGSDEFIRESFKRYNVTIRTFGQYDVTYSHTVNAVGTPNRLMYIGLLEGNKHPYGKHVVVGYAYTRLMDKNGMGRAFIKICDGWYSDARYIEIDSVSPGATYWEVNCS